ncbi:hypothetical protein [Pseudomonas sp. CYM-20-01]|uniref:hypothetical protein n=1 Tax=Pseudomonas sp. CYM-20-01 TaxID=2870750 RepID=UPI0020BFE7D6|nr:hypothetical protein [Pseudomonas sp. CYM-20-01]
MTLFRRALLLMASGTASSAISAAQTGKGTSDDLLWAFLLAAPPVAYAVNKWWRWGLGFKFGNASGAGFLSALKWSSIAAVWVAIVMGLVWLMYKN